MSVAETINKNTNRKKPILDRDPQFHNNVVIPSWIELSLIDADYYLIQKENLSNKDLYSDSKDSSYYYSGGWHIKGIYSLIIGFIFSASTIWNTNLMFLQSYAWIIGAFVSWITYYLLAKK